MSKGIFTKINGGLKQVKNVWIKKNGVLKQKVIPKTWLNNSLREFMSYHECFLAFLHGNNYDTNFLEILDTNLNKIKTESISDKYKDYDMTLQDVIINNNENITISINTNQVRILDKEFKELKGRTVSNLNFIYKIIGLDDQGYCVSGGSYSSGIYSHRIVRLDSDLTTVWYKIKSSANNYFSSCTNDEDGNIYHLYATKSVYIDKYDVNGNVLKTQVQVATVPTAFKTIEYCNGYIYVNSYSDVIKLDTELNVIWARTVGNNVELLGVDNEGNAYAIAGTNVVKITTDNILSSFSSKYVFTDIAFDHENNIYHVDSSAIRKVDTFGSIIVSKANNSGIKYIDAI